MKQLIFKDRELMLKLKAKGRKVKSHGTHRAKRHPGSPRLKS